jgi:glycosyltransferase involved in cell wall biosynthesis
MRVAAWFSGARPGPVATGVGKFYARMVGGLAAQPDVQLQILGDASEHQRSRRGPVAAGPLDHLPYRQLPWPRRLGSYVVQPLGLPTVERFCGEVDWLYCPREVALPTARAKLAVTVHDLYALESSAGRGGQPLWRQRLRRTLLRQTLQRATLVVADSEFTAGRIAEIFPHLAAPVRIIGCGVDAALLAHRPSLPTFSRPYFVAVGGLTHKKGAEYLLALADRLPSLFADHDLVVLGPVEPAYLHRAAATPALRVFPRGLSDLEVADLVANARVSLTLSRYEGFGIPVLEAMALGTPVIVSDRASLPEVAGEAGIVLPPQDTDALLDALWRLESDPVLRAAQVAAGRARAAEHTWDHSVMRLHRTLKDWPA